MPQRSVIELLALKFSGEATPKDLAELEKLTAENPESVYHEELLKQVFVKGEEEADPEYQYNLHRLKYQDKLIFAGQNLVAFKQVKFRKYYAAACFSVLILLAGSLFTYQIKYAKNSTIYNTKIISGEGMRKKVLLPDGTTVWLNAESNLVYDKDMGKRSKREVQLTGEAFFDVAHDKLHPFIIKTSKVSVKVLGTAFNIKAYPQDAKTETTLIRGSIELTVNDRKTEKIILKPAEKFALINSRAKVAGLNNNQINEAADITMMIQNVSPVKVAGKEYTEEVSWVDNELVFNNESFEEIVPKLERWYNIKINIDKNSINAYHFTGVFTDESLTEALTALKLIKPFNFKINDHDVTIY